MNKNSIVFYYFFTFIILFSGNLSYAQQKKVKSKTQKSIATESNNAEQTLLSKEEEADYKRRIGSLISFLEFALNTIGNDSSAAEDKEVIINRSYLKFFKDNKVQIEDDLDEHRLVKTYKSIQAYLQDVDYFFKYVKFDLTIDEITSFLNEPSPYFKVSLTRYIKGITNEGDSIFNNKKRYVEVNLNVKQKDIKIASIYSTALNEEEELNTWWKGLSPAWQGIFKKEMGNVDSLNFGQLKRILNTQELNLSNNKDITDINALNRITALKILDISNTNIYDIVPLRNLTNLEILNCSGSLVKNFEPLKYSINLKELHFNNTKVDSIFSVGKFINLEKISFAQSEVKDLTPLLTLSKLKYVDAGNSKIQNINKLSTLKNLEYLDISKTAITNIDSLGSLDKLEKLNISETSITDLTAIKNFKNLKSLSINKTNIASLSTIDTLKFIQKVYADKSKITKEEATRYMSTHPGCIVIYHSEDAQNWWNSIDENWKKIFNNYTALDANPTQDQIARLLNQKEIDISNNKSIQNLEPLKAFYNLKIIKLNNTDVSSLEPLNQSSQLEILEANNSKIKSLAPLKNLALLKLIKCDNTNMDSVEVYSFKESNQKVNVVFRSEKLKSWWAGVDDNWRAAFKQNYPFDGLPTNEQLHSLTSLQKLTILNNSNISNLDPLVELDQLVDLEIVNCRINILSPLSKIKSLKAINFSKNPIKDISELSKMPQLKSINLENTGINNLESLKNLTFLEELNASSTPLKSIDHLEKINTLLSLDISSTAISNLNDLLNNKNLKSLKCFNTKLSSKKVEKFKKELPQCDVIYY